jgi:hypothetical protein
MEFPGWTVMPNYFSLRWLPFIPAEVFHFDYRWIGLLVWSGVILYYTFRVYRTTDRLISFFIACTAPWMMVLAFIRYDDIAFGNAVELLIAAFYLLLAFSVFRSPSVMAVGILLCLLSRISFTFWLPMYGLVILAHCGWSTALRTALYVCAGVALLFVIPFILPDGGKMFFAGLQYYEKSAMGEWYRQGWQEAADVPTHLGRGIGFARYWYQAGAEKLQFAACNRAFQLISLFTAVGLFVLYWLGRKRKLNMVVFGVVSLKVYLSVFYAFIPIPYHYLYVTPCFLSLALVPLWFECE